MQDPIVVVDITGIEEPRRRRLYLGDDRTGRALEVIAVLDDGRLIVIHAMDLRSKYRSLYEKGKGQ